MDIKYFCPAWGIMDWFDYGDNFDRQCQRIKEAGYDGVEMWAPRTDEERKQHDEILGRYDLLFNVGMGTGGDDAKAHITSLEQGMREAATAGATTVACHSGSDFLSFEDNLEIVKAAADLEEEMGILFTHETHRGRMLYNLPDTLRYVAAEPRMKLNADFSHWVCVHESDLTMHADKMAICIDRSYHVHARVGHSEGPQVTDPRAPEWQHFVDIHFGWWQQIIDKRKAEGLKQLTICPEFGAPTYMVCVPYTEQPLADQFAINAFIMNELKARNP